MLSLRRTCLPLFLCFALLITFSPQQIISQDLVSTDVSKHIDVDALQHPYIFFNDEDKAEIIDRIKTDPTSRDIFRELLGEGKMLMFRPVDPRIPERGTHDRAGWTELDRENPYRKKQNLYQRSAFVLAFLYQMTGEERYAHKAFEFAEVVSSLPTWTWQAHEFPIIYSRVMPWGAPDDQVNFNYDLGNATTGMYMALVFDWLYPALTTPQRDRIRGALLEKVITPVRGDYEFHWWATAYRTNWVGVCGSGLGLTALALLKNHPQLTDVVAESWNRIGKMIGELGVDGGWQEGGSYWRFGIERAILFGFALNRMTDRNINMFEEERLKSNPVAFPLYLFVPPNRSINFGDSGSRAIGNTELFSLLVDETGSQEGAWYLDEVLHEGEGLFDLIFPKPEVEPKIPEVTSRHFRTIDWWVMRSDFMDQDKVIVAGKAGKHDDPHHGHLDVGHFTVYWKGQAFIKDTGIGYYDEEYFDDLRWTYPQTSSGGHNTVLVNGEEQIPGKWRGKPFDYSIGGEVLKFESGAAKDYVLMDGTNAYPKKELKKWRRHISLAKPHLTFVLDEVETNAPNAEVELRFHTEGEFDLNSDHALLHGDNEKMALISLSEDGHNLRSGRHAYQPIHETREFEWLPYFGVVSTPSDTRTLMANVIAPVEDASEASAIAESLEWTKAGDDVSVSFTYRGETMEFSYTSSSEGLVAN